ncbi:MAG: hypothetical protein RIT24_1705, partial [Planctomycetota bacterium]
MPLRGEAREGMGGRATNSHRHPRAARSSADYSLRLMTGATSPSPSDLPSQIGPFQILAQLGEGSFGVVYKAERRTPVR